MAKKQAVKSDKKKPIALKKEGNAYDKILKENIEKIFRPLVEKRLGVKIIGKLQTIIHNKRVLKRYVNQLMMLSRLRKIEALTIKISEEMPIQFDYETDTLYLRGNEKGRKEGREEGRTKNVLSIWQEGIEPLVIARWLDLPIEQVERIIAKFQGENAENAVKNSI